MLTNYTKDLKLENESGNKLFDTMLSFGRKALVVYGGKIQLVGKTFGPT